MEEIQNLQEILTTSESASGQMVNKEKTNMTFSKNVPNDLQAAIKNLWGV